MSERTAPALAKIDRLLPVLTSLPADADSEGLRQNAEALRRAVSAFHMEAIRFRMYNVERLLRREGDAHTAARVVFEDVRQALEAAGFHTRSHEK